MAKFNAPDPRNNGTFVWVNGLVKREEAAVSPLDSVVQGGDAVWEGLRVREGHVIQFAEHAERMVDSAKALAFAEVPGVEQVWSAVEETLKANQMRDGVHIRLTLSRGRKSTSGMDPRLNVFGPTLIVLPEYKGRVYGDDGLTLITASIRRNAPSFLDSKIHHNNLLNNILAKIEANVAGADDAVMLDERGFLAETNATNLFLVKNGVLKTPRATACLPGLTRRYVLESAAALGIEAIEADLSLTELYTSDEAFTTGTMGDLAHIDRVDGRDLPAGPGPITKQLKHHYSQNILRTGRPLNF